MLKFHGIISLNNEFGEICIADVAEAQKMIDPRCNFIFYPEFTLHRIDFRKGLTAEQHQNGIGDFLLLDYSLSI